MGAEALVVSALVNFVDGSAHSGCILAVVASAVDYGAGSGRDAGLVAVVFGAGACTIYGSRARRAFRVKNSDD